MKLGLEVLEQLLLTLWHVLPWLAGMGAVFAVLSRLSPCNQGKPWWEKRGLATDVCYWIFVPIFTRFLRIGVTVLFTIWLFHISDGMQISEFYKHGHGALSHLPLWLQAIGYLVATGAIPSFDPGSQHVWARSGTRSRLRSSRVPKMPASKSKL